MLYSVAMRALVILALVAGCQSAYDARDLNGGTKSGTGSGSGSGSGGGVPECQADGDCALVAATCCECPTYAVPVADPAVHGCDTVACPPMSCANNVRAACSGGACTVACAALACDQSCATGFELDATGCLACACAAPAQAQSCSKDADCVRVRADCCGCAKGGTDTAVPQSEAASFDATLMCPPDPVCSGTDTCAPDLAPRCIQGACELAPPIPPGACGRPDLPACPAGQVCTLNANADATRQGVGVCM